MLPNLQNPFLWQFLASKPPPYATSGYAPALFSTWMDQIVSGSTMTSILGSINRGLDSVPGARSVDNRLQFSALYLEVGHDYRLQFSALNVKVGHDYRL